MTAMEQGAKRIIWDWLRPKRGERITILTEAAYLPQAEALRRQAEQTGAEVFLLCLSPRGEQVGEELELPPVSDTLDRSDTIIGATKYSVLTAARISRAVSEGQRFLSLPLFTCSGKDMLAMPFLKMPPTEAAKMAEVLLKKLSGKETVRITTDSGTDLRLSVTGRRAGAFTGDFSCGSCCDSSCFEVYVAPLEGVTEGMLVVDASLGYIGAPKQPVKLRFRGGRLVEIEDSAEGNRLRDYISSFADDGMNVAAELGMGLNTHGSCRGDCYIEDESVYGTFHIGMGRNLTFGGSNEAAGHYDLVCWRPTIYFDGEPAYRDGEIVF